MSITKDSGRQYPLVAVVDITYDDFVVSGDETSGVYEAIDLPANATVVGGELIVDTAWDTATTATADIGDDGDPDRYTASPLNLKSAGRTALALTGYEYTASNTIDIDFVTAGADATAGAARLIVQYVIDDRACENQG